MSQRVTTDWTVTPLRELIHHLVDDDHVSFRDCLNELQRDLDAIVAAGRDDPAILNHLPRIFSNLKRELEVHMHHEEVDLFPVIEKYAAAAEVGAPLPGSPLAAFGGPVHVTELEHESAAAAMRLMRDFCRDYKTPTGGSPGYRAFIERLNEFEAKIQVHMHLENNVLFPRASALHRRKNK
jgi:regulator of cell morphogenesis and NO signaling